MSVHDQANGIRLCVICHKNLDKVEAPTWVFIPSDLDFFIEAEEADYQRRLNEYRTSGDYPLRICPGIEDFRELCGGMYDAYMLREYEGQGNWRPGRSTYLPQSKQWHGDPMITLQKGFLALGSYSLLLPRKLQGLSELYQRHDIPPRSQSAMPNLNRRNPHQDGGNPDDALDPSPPDPGPSASGLHKRSSTRGRGRGRPRGRGYQTGRANRASQDYPATHGQQPRGQRPKCGPVKQQERYLSPNRIKKTTKRWVWGPHLTGKEMVDLYKLDRVYRQAWPPEHEPKGAGHTAFDLPSSAASEICHLSGQKGSACHTKVTNWLSGMSDEA